MKVLSIALASIAFLVAVDARAAGRLTDCVSTSSAEDMLPGVRFGDAPYVLYRCRFVGTTALPYDATGRIYAYDTPAWILAPVDLAAGNGTLVVDPFHTVGARALTPSGGEGERPQALRGLLGPRFLFREGRYTWATVRWDKRAMNSPAPATTFDHLYSIKYGWPLGSYEAPANEGEADGGWLGAAILADFADAVRSGRITMNDDSERAFARVERTIAVGISQTGRMLRMLLNDPPSGHHAPLFDGWLVLEARGRWNLWPQVDATGTFKAGGAIVRDQPQPAERGHIFEINTEQDVGPNGTDPEFGGEYVRYGNPPVQRSYEISSAAHLDHRDRLVNGNPNGTLFLPDRADLLAEALAVASAAPTYVPLILDTRDCTKATPARCNNPLDKSPFFRALMAALDAWLRDGTEPPPSRWLLSTPRGGDKPDPRYGAIAVGTDGLPIFARDDAGNALGGIRSPYVEAGRGRFYARAPGNPVLLNGSYVDGASAFARHGDFLRPFARQAAALVSERFLLPTDADLLVEEAAGSLVGVPAGSRKTAEPTPF